MQDYIDQGGNAGSAGYEDEQYDSGDGSLVRRNKSIKLNKKSGKQSKNPVSDIENGEQEHKMMRIASSGQPINNLNLNDLHSIEGDRSLDPDHEPRKEGTASAVVLK